jgi:hypothetical protein
VAGFGPWGFKSLRPHLSKKSLPGKQLPEKSPTGGIGSGLMRKCFCVLALLVALALTVASAAGAREQQPQVTIVEACNVFGGAPYAIGYTFTGGVPGEIVSVVVSFDGEFIVGSTERLDGQGSLSNLPAAVGRATPLGLVTVEVFANPLELEIPDASLQLLASDTLASPCEGSTRPTSKARCKNGGWRTFRVFKNQGDCVRFVSAKA